MDITTLEYGRNLINDMKQNRKGINKVKSTLFLTRRFYIVLAVLVFITGMGSFVPPMFLIGRWLLVALGVLLLLEAFLLYHERGIMARRTMADRFSNGDDNEVNIRVESIYSFPVLLHVIDEIPPVFQRRDIHFRLRLGMVIIALKQYRLYHSNDTASLAWLQVSLFTWLAIPV